MNFIDLKAQQEKIRADIDRRITAVLDHGAYVMGPEVAELEKSLADYVGVKHAVACASGTDGLLMALMALGMEPGDAVFTSPFTFVATAEVISLLGATPIFVDIDPRTFNIDAGKIPEAIEVARKQHLTPKAIMPVDIFGLPADYTAIEKVASQHNLLVIEDGCQGFGGSYDGKKLCSFGDVAATSFYPAKPLACYGDGGAVFTDDDKLAEKLISIRIHGMGASQYDNVRLGITGRMDTIQAAILLSKLEIFDGEIKARQTVADIYNAGIGDLLETQNVPAGCQSAWAQFSLLSPERDKVREALKQDGIPTAVYYPKPLHLQPAYDYLGYSKGDFPVSETVCDNVFSLPMHPYLKKADADRVVEAIKRIAT